MIESGRNKSIMFALSFLWQLGVTVASASIQLTWTLPLDQIPVLIQYTLNFHLFSGLTGVMAVIMKPSILAVALMANYEIWRIVCVTSSPSSFVTSALTCLVAL